MMERIEVDPSNYMNGRTTFARPSVVGELFVHENGQIELGRSRVRYLYERALLQSGGECKLNLNDGYERFIDKEGLPYGNIRALLRWIQALASSDTQLSKVCHEAHIACQRGVLRRIACTPYEQNEPWRLAAVRYKSVIFLCEFITETQLKKVNAMTEREKLMAFWGLKFEQYLTCDKQTSEPCTSEAVNNREEFDVVMKTKIENQNNAGDSVQPIRLMYLAETDCINRNGDYVELKTQRLQFNHSFWRLKSLKWWIQSFLVGIEKIVVGFRDDAGFVRRVQMVDLSILPKQGAQHWSGVVVLNFLAKILAVIKRRLDLSPELVYHLIDYNPQSNKVIFETVQSGDNSFDFLDREFLLHFAQSD